MDMENKNGHGVSYRQWSALSHLTIKSCSLVCDVVCTITDQCGCNLSFQCGIRPQYS